MPHSQNYGKHMPKTTLYQFYRFDSDYDIGIWSRLQLHTFVEVLCHQPQVGVDVVDVKISFGVLQSERENNRFPNIIKLYTNAWNV